MQVREVPLFRRVTYHLDMAGGSPGRMAVHRDMLWYYDLDGKMHLLDLTIGFNEKYLVKFRFYFKNIFKKMSSYFGVYIVNV